MDFQNASRSRRNQLDEAWLDVLLDETYRSGSENHDEKIVAVMQRLDEAPQVTFTGTRSPWFSLRHLSALAIAASLLILAVFVIEPTDTQAQAAVVRSSRPVSSIRHYKVHMLLQRPGGSERELTANVYIDASNRYVIEHPSFMGWGTTWLGGDSGQRWLVSPRGPALVGERPVMDRWLARRDAFSPLLHLNTILDRMSRAYRLKMQPEENLTTARDAHISCTHVHGQLNWDRPWLPATIDLWANANTGVAEKLVLNWFTAPQRRGPRQWTIELVDDHALVSNDWFDVHAHSGSKRIVQVRSEKELDEGR